MSTNVHQSDSMAPRYRRASAGMNNSKHWLKCAILAVALAVSMGLNAQTARDDVPLPPA